jgi:hypothetical protein
MGLPGRPQLLDLRDVEDAVRAVRRVTAGQTRLQIRQRLIEELESRGVILPPPDVDGFAAEIVARGGGLAGRVRRESRRAGQLAQAASFGIQVLRAVRQHRPVPRMESSGMRSVWPDPRHLREQADLEPGAQAVLDIDTHNPINVWLEFAGHVSHDDAGTEAVPAPSDDGPVLVFLGDYRVGRLGAEASQLYRPAILAARAAGVIVVVTALRDRAEDGSWRLYIPWPDSSGLTG